jgi:hypothetical protein
MISFRGGSNPVFMEQFSFGIDIVANGDDDVHPSIVAATFQEDVIVGAGDVSGECGA